MCGFVNLRRVRRNFINKEQHCGVRWTSAQIKHTVLHSFQCHNTKMVHFRLRQMHFLYTTNPNVHRSFYTDSVIAIYTHITFYCTTAKIPSVIRNRSNLEKNLLFNKWPCKILSNACVRIISENFERVFKGHEMHIPDMNVRVFFRKIIYDLIAKKFPFT